MHTKTSHSVHTITEQASLAIIVAPTSTQGNTYGTASNYGALRHCSNSINSINSKNNISSYNKQHHCLAQGNYKEEFIQKMTNLSTSSQDSSCTPSPPMQEQTDLDASCKMSKGSYGIKSEMTQDTSSYLGM